MLIYLILYDPAGKPVIVWYNIPFECYYTSSFIACQYAVGKKQRKKAPGHFYRAVRELIRLSVIHEYVFSVNYLRYFCICHSAFISS